MMKPLFYDFKNDVLYKYVLGNDQNLNSNYLLNLLIEELCHVQCKSITIKNSGLIK